MVRYADIDYRLTLRPRGNGGKPFDLSPWVESLTRSKTIRGSSAGSWSAGVVFGDDPASQAAESIFRGRVRDDDWGTLELIDRVAGTSSNWDILTDQRAVAEVYAETGAAGRDYQIAGRDWSKCMTDTEIRLGSVFQHANTADVIEFNATVVKVLEVVVPLRMPGFVDWQNWDLIVKAAAEGAGLGMTASEPLKKALAVMLWGLWVDPDGQSLLDRLRERGWSRFGPVYGCPWQLMNLVSQTTITPDAVLRQFGNTEFNEVFYTSGADGGPLIVFRQKPFLRRHWTALPVTDWTADGSVLSVQASQSGAERLTYYRPQSAIAMLQGIDQIVDTRTGRMPLIERSQLKYHGVRPAEPPDNYWPPGTGPTEPMLEWHRRRIGIFRSWYYWNAEFLSGTVRRSPADPRVQIGTRVRFPLEWEFLLGDRVVKTSVIEGYVTDVTDTVSETAEGRETETVVTFVRGQPPEGLAIPAVERWTSGAKRTKVFTEGVGSVRSVDQVIEVWGVQAPVLGGYAVYHYDALWNLDVLHGTRAEGAPVTNLYVHITDGTNNYPPTTIQSWLKAYESTGDQASTHFIITTSGDIWQLLDAGNHVAYGVAGGAMDYNRVGINIDFVARSTQPGMQAITPPQWGAFKALLRALKTGVDLAGAPLLPSLHMDTLGARAGEDFRKGGEGETPAQWAARLGTSLAALAPGVYGHGQLQANRSDPTVPAWNQATWLQVQTIVDEVEAGG